MSNNKVVVITGAANGIGKGIAKEFSKNGFRVAFIDIDKKSGVILLNELNEDCCYYHGDISKKEDLELFKDFVINKYKKIDCLINNAMINNKGILTNCSYEDFQKCLQIGVTAPYYLTSLFLDFFNKNASIINISSTRAKMSQSNTESYTASKGGISSLTHALAVSLAGRVRVNSISPGWIDTTESHLEEADLKQHLIGRVGKVEDIVKMVNFLISDDAAFITGQDFIVDGGMTKLMIYHNDEGWLKKV